MLNMAVGIHHLRKVKSGLHIVVALNHRKRVQYLTKQTDVTKYCMYVEYVFTTVTVAVLL